MNIHEKLLVIQSTLKSPKNQYNSFAKYNYRSLEDITEAVKPLLNETKTVLIVEDEPFMIGDRVYIKATASLVDTEDTTQIIKNTAFAREPLSKKGSDDSQITGATSSYARKYCLNGLFCIDDNKDADSMPPEKGKQPAPKSQTTSFEKSMQQYAKNYPAAYQKVLEKWNLTTAKGIVDQPTQQGLLTQIEATIDAMESVPA